MSDDILVVGTYQGNSAYSFVRTGTNWSQLGSLIAFDIRWYYYRFGEAVAVSGDTAVIGAPGVGPCFFRCDWPVPYGATYAFTICPACTQLAIAPDGSRGYFLRFTGTPDVTYRLQRAPSVTGPWDTIATLTAPASGLIEFHDTNAPPGQAFYRAAQP